jgi:pSer/pThr/pTyr-binding forkhead associated (FHA) protein
MRAKLKVARGSNAGKVFDISVPQFVIGRATGCHLRPQSDAISRQHCAIFLRPDHVAIKDLGSRNGTILNGEKITAEERLATGDELRIGPLRFEVIVTDDAGVVQQPPGPKKEDRQVEGVPSDSGLISEWLLEEDEAERSQRRADPETRQFKLDDSEPLVVRDDAQGDAAKAKKKDVKKKKEPGKLPGRPQDSAASSQEAAAETLKRMYNRGT